MSRLVVGLFIVIELCGFPKFVTTGKYFRSGKFTFHMTCKRREGRFSLCIADCRVICAINRRWATEHLLLDLFLHFSTRRLVEKCKIDIPINCFTHINRHYFTHIISHSKQPHCIGVHPFFKVKKTNVKSSCPHVWLLYTNRIWPSYVEGWSWQCQINVSLPAVAQNLITLTKFC